MRLTPESGFPKRQLSSKEPGGRPLSFPVSFAQQRLWFLHYLEPTVPSYNLPVALRLTGPLDAGALKESLNEIVRRHDALRTTFPVWEGRPVQVISPARLVPVPETDLGDRPPAEREREASRSASLEANRPFDLAKGPLFRAKLLRLAEQEHVLIVTMHHIVSDGWSLDILLHELAVLYDAFRQGKPSPLEELPIQYADYALWQQNWLRGDVLETQLAYWKKQLAGIPSLLELPTDRPRAAMHSSRGASLGGMLPPGLLQELQKLARSEDATLFMTLLAAFQAFLSRYTGQEDIPVGSPIAGRTQVETEGLIGFFVNTLVLRGDLSGDPTFRQLLARVRETALEAYAHQDVPFEKLVEELHPARSLGHTPLFQVLFQLIPAGRIGSELSDLKTETFRLEGGIAKFDLSLRTVVRPDRISCVFEYKTDLFDAETIRRMLEHWKTFLAGIVADPARRVSEIPLLSDEERRMILVEWNATATSYPREKSIGESFESQVASTPDAVALIFGKEQLTYAELNRRANRLARSLRDRGIGPEVPVGVFLERSFEMVVGILAILKAGGAYVPLDSSYPKERLAFLIADTGMPLVLTASRLAERLPDPGPMRLCLDAEAAGNGGQSEENLQPAVSGDGLAYVMYTSGSTGTPKGVAIPHRGVLRLVKGTDYARIDSDEVFLQLAPVSFDASTFELWGALLNGVRLILYPAARPSLEELGEFIQSCGVTTLWLTAGLFHQM